MGGIDFALKRLQPVAFLNPHRDVHLLLRDQIPFQVRQRRGIGRVRAHIGPKHPVSLLAGIGLDPGAFLEAAARRLSRHVGHRAGHIEFPAMVDAAQSAIFVSPKDQRCAAVRTGLVNQTDPAFGIPEGNQILAQQPDTFRLPVLDQIGRRQKGNPVKPEQVSKGRPLPDPDQSFIVFVRKHDVPPSDLAVHSGKLFCRVAQESGDAGRQSGIANGPKRV
jgi:hypothetical protein